MLKRLMIIEIGFDLKIRYLGIFRGPLNKKTQHNATFF
jgi:hypothetical protein